jgi:hypothetical protein
MPQHLRVAMNKLNGFLAEVDTSAVQPLNYIQRHVI